MKNYTYEEMRTWLCHMLEGNTCPRETDLTFECKGHDCLDCASLILDEYERLILNKYNVAPQNTLDYTAEKEAWVDRMNNEFANTNSKWSYEIYCDPDHRVLVYKVGRSGIVKAGLARCNPNDIFDTRFGIAIAYARAQKYVIPFYMFL